MKKTYINPTLEVVDIKTNGQLLAGSIIIGDEGSADEAESRDFPLWLLND